MSVQLLLVSMVLAFTAIVGIVWQSRARAARRLRVAADAHAAQELAQLKAAMDAHAEREIAYHQRWKAPIRARAWSTRRGVLQN